MGDLGVQSALHWNGIFIVLTAHDVIGACPTWVAPLAGSRWDPEPHEPVGLHRFEPEAFLAGLGCRPDEAQAIGGLEVPASAQPLGRVGAPRTARLQPASRSQREAAAPAAPGQRRARSDEDLPRADILLVTVDPLSLQARRGDGPRHAYLPSRRRGPERVARMRATWPLVNMNIASSST